MINLQRNGAGDYTVRGDKGAVHIVRQLSRRWLVEPLEGLEFPPTEVASYTDAKNAAERLIIRKPVNVEAGVQPDGKPGPMRQLAAGLRLLADEVERA